MTRADRLKEIRRQLGWTQDDLAKRAEGLDREAVSKIERGKNQVTGGQVQAALAAAFGVGIPDVLAALDGKIDAVRFATMVTKRQAPDLGPERFVEPESGGHPETPAHGNPLQEALRKLGSDDELGRYPGLMTAVTQAAIEGRPYDDAVVRATKALAFYSREQITPERWREYLDHERAIGKAIGSGLPPPRVVTQDMVAMPTYKPKRK